MHHTTEPLTRGFHRPVPQRRSHPRAWSPLAVLTAALCLGNAALAAPPAEAPPRPTAPAAAPAAPAPSPAAALPDGMRCLLAAYPDDLCSGTPTELVWCDGTRMRWDDGVAKPDHEVLLDTADLQDQMAQRYPLGAAWTPPPALNFEPGRIRHEPFFEKMYGGSAAQVRATLAPVRWIDGTTVRVTTKNRVHERLQAVADEVAKLPKEVRDVVAKTAGTFNWRAIRGTKRRSMHSYAVAIDVGVANSDFWRWAKPGKDGRLPWKNRIPEEVARIFEAHGFIWGGKWYHFDTMHFEYRPELLADPCVQR